MTALQEEQDPVLASQSESTSEESTTIVSDKVPSLTETRAVELSVGANAVDNSLYHIKWIKFHKNDCPIVTQNENGPCPLIAIMNVLLLRRVIEFSKGIEYITTTDLMKHLGESFVLYQNCVGMLFLAQCFS